MAAPLTCPGCGEREGVRLVLGSPRPGRAAEADRRDVVRGDRSVRPRSPRTWVDSACRACGARWASEAPPSR
ncbi:hypothetical protein [Quadrisphaera sp. KR29]|uniref:hypothetical protein n=1 Tax=Quadrisphaera sp. KR29 TaxID=3461391 RepID=UPI004043B781